MLRTLNWSSGWRFSITAVDRSKLPSWAKERICSNFGLTTPLKTLVTIAKQIAPPISQNSITAAVATAVPNIRSLKRLDNQGYLPKSFSSIAGGVMSVRVVKFNPNPKPMIIWKPYWLAAIPLSPDNVDMRDRPMVWKIPPTTRTRIGEIFSFPVKTPTRADAKGQNTVKGSNLPPAASAEVPLISWKRWGIWIKHVKNGIPRRKVLLSLWAFISIIINSVLCALGYLQLLTLCPMRIRLVKKCHGSTGSCVCLWVVKTIPSTTSLSKLARKTPKGSPREEKTMLCHWLPLVKHKRGR